MRRWREANRDEMRTAQKKYLDNPANKEKIREARRNYLSKKAAEAPEQSLCLEIKK